ncbi:MAG: efflux RND transporter periplasmic adaptor subunit [Litorivicinus sp.]
MKTLSVLFALALSPFVHAFSVKVETSQSQPISLSVSALGSVESAQEAPVKARINGVVEQLLVREGSTVKAGQLLAVLSDDDRELSLDRAEGEYRRLQTELNRQNALFEQQLVTQSTVDATQSALKSAENVLAQAKQQVQWREIRAPFAGVVSELYVQQGEVVGAQSALVHLMDAGSVKVTVQIPQDEIASVTQGSPVVLRSNTALPTAGEVIYVSQSASGATRMFDVEVQPKPDHALRVGMSVSAEIEVAEVAAHFVSPAWLFLDDAGIVGIKSVNDQQQVEFYPVELVRSDAQGFFVTGLPDRLDIITVGAGFVNTGSQVEVAR